MAKQRVVNLKDFEVVEIPEEHLNIVEWCPGDNTVARATEVHILVMTPTKLGFAIRLRTRKGAEDFIKTLQEHADSVWPIS